MKSSTEFGRIAGALYGVAAGDALGAPLEFMSAEAIDHAYGTVRDMIGGGWLNVKPGEVTDDTQMTLAVAYGILESPEKPVEAIGARFIKWYDGSPKDVGATCSTAIRKAKSNSRRSYAPSEKEWMDAALKTHELMGGRSAGNGTLMRTAYVGLYYDNESDICEKAKAISKMTHYDPVAATDCAAYCLMLNRMTREDILSARRDIIRVVLAMYEDCSSRYSYEELSRESYRPNPSGYVVDSFAAALHCIFTTASFEAALVKAVNLGGDADTIGAITGGLAGALYGIANVPMRWRGQLDHTTDMKLNYLAGVACGRRTFAREKRKVMA